MTADRIGLTLIACLTAVIPTAHTTGLRNTWPGCWRYWSSAGPSGTGNQPFRLLAGGLDRGFAWCRRYGRLRQGCHLAMPWVRPCFRCCAPLVRRSGSGVIDAIVGLVFPVVCTVALMVLRFAHLANGGDDGVVERVYENHWPGRGVFEYLGHHDSAVCAWLIAIGRRNLGLGLFAVTVIAGLQNWNRMFWIAMLVTLIPCLFMFRLSRRVLVVLGLAGFCWLGRGILFGFTNLRSPKRSLARWWPIRSKRRPAWDLGDWTGLVVERPWAYGYGLRSAIRLPGAAAPVGATRDFHPHNILSGWPVPGTLGFFAYGGLLVDFVRRFWGVAWCRKVAPPPGGDRADSRDGGQEPDRRLCTMGGPCCSGCCWRFFRPGGLDRGTAREGSVPDSHHPPRQYRRF